MKFTVESYNDLQEKPQNVENFYVIAFGNIVYVGKVIQSDGSAITVKFLERKFSDQYDWYKRDRIETINKEQVICGPLKIRGTLPFKINGTQKALAAFLKHKKNLQ